MNPRLSTTARSVLALAALAAGVTPCAHAQSSPVALATLDGNNGYALLGDRNADRAGSSVASAGDVNGDGIDDVIIGADGADSNGADAGLSYVVFGRGSSAPPSLSLSALNGSDGFALKGEAAADISGRVVAAAGDVNNDGFDDVIVAAPGAGAGDRGRAYVVFGHAGVFPATLALASLNGEAGFIIEGETAGDGIATAMGSAGDVNGDGIDDMLIGTRTADTNGTNSGRAYVVFGRTTAVASPLLLSSLDGVNGFAIDGAFAGNNAGASAAAAGDVNGDGIDDVIIGAPNADRQDNLRTGLAHVVFGRSTAFSSLLRLRDLDGVTGFTIEGEAAGDNFGDAVSGAGDVNGDGVDDLLIGATNADPGARTSAGRSYLLFGRAAGFGARIGVTTLAATEGFKIDGETEQDQSGRAIASAGDVNDDGFDDVIIGAVSAARADGADTGRAYLILGRAAAIGAPVQLASLVATDGFGMDGERGGDSTGRAVGGRGDFNGDGVDDLIVGSPGAGVPGNLTGRAHIVFGVREAVFANSFE